MAVDFDGTDDNLDLTGLTQTASNYSLFHVRKRDKLENQWLFDSASGRLIIDAGSDGFFYDGSFKGTAITEATQCLSAILLVSPSSAASYINGTLQDSGENYTQTAIGGNTILGDSSAVAVRNIQSIFNPWRWGGFHQDKGIDHSKK